MEDNKLFILLANILHEGQGVSEALKHVVDDIFTHCTTEQVSKREIEQNIKEKFGNISTQPIYADEIKEESLEIATSITFGIYFCSSDLESYNRDFELKKFYQELFEKFSLETVLKVLARIITYTKEKKLVQYYNTASKLFDKTTRVINLRNKDIAVLSTADSELDLYPDLRNHQVNKGKVHLIDLSKGLLALTCFDLEDFQPDFCGGELNEP